MAIKKDLPKIYQTVAEYLAKQRRAAVTEVRLDLLHHHPAEDVGPGVVRRRANALRAGLDGQVAEEVDADPSEHYVTAIEIGDPKMKRYVLESGSQPCLVFVTGSGSVARSEIACHRSPANERSADEGKHGCERKAHRRLARQ